MVDLNLILTAIIIINLCFLTARTFMLYNLTLKRMDILKKRMDYLFLLIDSAASGMCNPMARAVYGKLRSLSVKEALEVDKQTFLREITSEGYAKTRKMLKETRDSTEDPEKREEYSIAINELDGIFNLLSSIGKDSEPEHVKKIMENVALCIDKMRQKGLDISIEGLDPF